MIFKTLKEPTIFQDQQTSNIWADTIWDDTESDFRSMESYLERVSWPNTN